MLTYHKEKITFQSLVEQWENIGSNNEIVYLSANDEC